MLNRVLYFFCVFRCGTFDVCDLTDRVYCCGDFSGSLVFWDIETLLQVDTVKAHSDIVNTIAGGGIGSSEVVTGSIFVYQVDVTTISLHKSYFIVQSSSRGIFLT